VASTRRRRESGPQRAAGRDAAAAAGGNAAAGTRVPGGSAPPGAAAARPPPQQQQRQRQRQGRAPPRPPDAALASILACASLDDLQALWRAQGQPGAQPAASDGGDGAVWAPPHAAAALMRLARLAPAPPKTRAAREARTQLAAELLAVVLAAGPDSGGSGGGGASAAPAAAPRDAASALWALAKAGIPLAGEEVVGLLGIIIAGSGGGNSSGKSSSGTSGGGGRRRAGAQDASMALWAVATACASPAPPRLRLSDLGPLLDLMAARFGEAAPQALSNAAWAAATLRGALVGEAPPPGGWPPPTWLGGLEAAAGAAGLGAHSGLGLYHLLWGLTRAGAAPAPAFLDAAWRAAAAAAPAASPQAASGALWALASLRAPPPPGCLEVWHAGTQPGIPSGWRPADLVSALWAHAALGAPPSHAWLAAALGRALELGLPSFDQVELTTLLWACARLGAAPPRPWLDAWLAAYERRALDAPLAPTLPLAAHALGRLRFRPPVAWAERLAAEAARQVEAMGPQELANLAWGLARLRLVPGAAWVRRFLKQVGPGGSKSGGAGALAGAVPRRSPLCERRRRGLAGTEHPLSDPPTPRRPCSWRTRSTMLSWRCSCGVCPRCCRRRLRRAAGSRPCWATRRPTRRAWRRGKRPCFSWRSRAGRAPPGAATAGAGQAGVLLCFSRLHAVPCHACQAVPLPPWDSHPATQAPAPAGAAVAVCGRRHAAAAALRRA
jgi:hypothetical protein